MVRQPPALLLVTLPALATHFSLLSVEALRMSTSFCKILVFSCSSAASCEEGRSHHPALTIGYLLGSCYHSTLRPCATATTLPCARTVSVSVSCFAPSSPPHMPGQNPAACGQRGSRHGRMSSRGGIYSPPAPRPLLPALTSLPAHGSSFSAPLPLPLWFSRCQQSAAADAVGQGWRS